MVAPLGKMMMGLRVVRDDGGPIRMRHSLVRALAMVFLDFWVTSGSSVGSAPWPPRGPSGWATTWPARSWWANGSRVTRTPIRTITMPAAAGRLGGRPGPGRGARRAGPQRAHVPAPGAHPGPDSPRAHRRALATQMAGYVRTPPPPAHPPRPTSPRCWPSAPGGRRARRPPPGQRDRDRRAAAGDGSAPAHRCPRTDQPLPVPRHRPPARLPRVSPHPPDPRAARPHRASRTRAG